MRPLTQLSQLTKYAPLSFKAHPSLYYDSLVKTSSEIPRGTEILEINTWVSGSKFNQIEPMRSSIMDSVVDYMATIYPDNELFDNRLRIFLQLSGIFRDKGSLLYDYAESLSLFNQNLPIYWKDPESTSSIPLRKMMSEDYLLYRNSYDKMFDVDKQLLSNIKFEEFVWINNLVNQRAVKHRGSLYLVPIFDHFPHSFDANTDFMRDAAVMRVFTTKKIPAGSTLTRNYGNMNNYWYLLNFGVIHEDNPFHKVVFPVENIPEWPQIIQKLGLTSKVVLNKLENPENYSLSKLKLELFQEFTEYGLAECGFSNEVPNKELETTFRVVFLNETDIQELGVKSYKELFSTDLRKSLNPKNQRNVELFLFKASEMMDEILAKGHPGKHPLGRQIEELDKALVKKNLAYYSSRFNP